MAEALIAGITGGVVTALALHPIDTLKIRLQVQDGLVAAVRYRSLTHAISSIIKEEGVSGLYKGAIAGCMGSGASWGLYFFAYEHVKRYLSSKNGGAQLGHIDHMGAAWLAGTATCLCTNPLWLIKTRMQLQLEGKDAKLKPYTGVWDAVRRIVAEEGPLALYKGIVPALFLVSHGMIQFAIYEEMKRYQNAVTALLPEGKDGDGKSSSFYFVAGAVSKAVATGVTYPYQVVKARLQQRVDPTINQVYKGFMDCVRTTAAREGARGFYKGFSANVLRVAPQSAITLVVYEKTKALLESFK
jgi:solute carrier family 25 folate transporter 32